MSLLALVGCSSSPTLKSEGLKGKSEISNVKPNKPSISEVLKVEQKSIAVTNIYYKKKGDNLKFVEEITTKYDSSVITPIAPNPGNTPPTNEKNQDSSDVIDNSPVFSQPMKFINLTEFDTNFLLSAIHSDAQQVKPTGNDKNSDIQQVKKTSFEENYEYGELRSFSSSIRGLLIKSGYKVIQANPAIPRASEGDEYFNVVERIKSGTFNGADYVMFGILGQMSLTENSEEIMGTRSSAQQIGLDILAEFAIVDTKTYEVIASFLVEGNGKEIRIDGKRNGFKPSMSKLMKQASDSMAEDVAKHLGDYKFIVSDRTDPEFLKNSKRRFNDDSSTLKIYKK